jgi:site-specific DNA recombinase
LENTFKDLISSHTEQVKTIKLHLTEVTKKIELIEEKFYVMGEMSKETFDKFNSKYKLEQEQILKELDSCQNPISNAGNILNKTIYLCENMHEMWASGNIRLREKLQQLVFPKGIVYDRKNQAFRTIKVNSVISAIAQPVGNGEDKKNRTAPFLSGQSGFVGVRRLELPTPCTPCKYASQLRHTPIVEF